MRTAVFLNTLKYLFSVWINRRELDSHIFFAFNFLQGDVLVEECEKNVTTQRYMVGKEDIF